MSRRIDDLPELLGTADIQLFFHMKKRKQAEYFVRIHRAKLKPIKVGRVLLIERDNFKTCYDSLHVV